MRKHLQRALLLSLVLIGMTSQRTEAQTWGDYTLYSTLNSTKAYLVDMSGNTYHQWTFSTSKKTGYSTYMLPGGTLLRTVANPGNSLNGGGMTGAVQKIDWNGNVLWDYVYSTSSYCLHHDICQMPNGNVLMIAYEVKTAAQSTQAGSTSNITIWSEKIIEVQPTGPTTGTIVWEWHVWDHLCQNVNSAKDNYVTSIVQHPELLNVNYSTTKDWMHVNGLDYNEALDQIVFSSHYLNEFYVIDHSTTSLEAAGHTGGNSGKGGDFLYRWGNPAAYGATGTKIFNVVHDAHFVPADCPKANYISAFNNKGGTGTKSCVDMVNPPYNGYNYTLSLGSAYAPASYDWRHTYSGSFTQDLGNSQQLPNGNTLVCIAMSGYMYEIDSNQAVVWSKNVSGTIPQAFRYTNCYVNGPPAAAASAAQASICLGASVQLNAPIGTGFTYNWSSNPPGFSSTLQNPIATPTVPTTYSVTVSSGSCSSSDSVAVGVNPLPAAPVISLDGSAMVSTAALSYQWYYENNIISGETNQSYTPSQDGNYQVQIVDTNGCNSALSTSYYYTVSGINNLHTGIRPGISPNPTNGLVTLNGLADYQDNYEVLVVDARGKIIVREKSATSIDLSALENGIYIVSISSARSLVLNKRIVLIK